MTLSNYIQYFDYITKPTEPLIRLVPADKLNWKPTPESFSVSQLVAHIGGALGAYGRGITTGEWRFSSLEEVMVMNQSSPTLSVEAAIELYKRNHREFKEKVGALTEERFTADELNTPQLGRVPRWRIAMFCIEHHLNHKAELYMYLKLLGITIDTANLYRG